MSIIKDISFILLAIISISLSFYNEQLKLELKIAKGRKRQEQIQKNQKKIGEDECVICRESFQRAALETQAKT